MESSDDIYARFDPPKALPYVGTLVAIAVFLITAYFTSNSAPFFAALSVGVVGMLIWLMWPLRHRWLLWFLITAVAIAHAIFLILIRLPAETSYGVEFTPIVGVDVFFFWRFIIWMLKITDHARAR